MDELVRRWRAEQEAGRPWDTVRVAEEVGTLPLMFDPGSYYNYGFSFDILGALIQIWTGLTLAQYCERHIFRPLGMRDSGFLLDGAGPVAEMCTFGPDGQLIHADEVGTPSVDAVNWGPPHFFSGGAGMISTLGDYFKFTRALALGGTADGVRLIGSRTLKLMSAPHLNARQLPGYNQGDPCAFGPSYNYGFGVRVMTEPIHGSSISSVGEWGWSGALGTWWQSIQRRTCTSSICTSTRRPTMMRTCPSCLQRSMLLWPEQYSRIKSASLRRGSTAAQAGA